MEEKHDELCEEEIGLGKENEHVNTPPKKKRWSATNRRRKEKLNSLPSMFSDELKEALCSDEAARQYFMSKEVFVQRNLCPSNGCEGGLVERMEKSTSWNSVLGWSPRRKKQG